MQRVLKTCAFSIQRVGVVALWALKYGKRWRLHVWLTTCSCASPSSLTCWDAARKDYGSSGRSEDSPMFSGSCDSRGSSSVVMFGDSPFPIAEASLRLPRLSTPSCRCCGGPHRNDVCFVYISSTDTVMISKELWKAYHIT